MITFLFYHYGKIPNYLKNAIEHVRIFNPDAEIRVITDKIKDTTMLECFNVSFSNAEDFASPELDELRRKYTHISWLNKRYALFSIERWFLTEIIRKADPQKTYVMLDSDVALFGDANLITRNLPEQPICLAGACPHFTFIKGDTSGFLNLILDFYNDHSLLEETKRLFAIGGSGRDDHNVDDMYFMFKSLKTKKYMDNYSRNQASGHIDSNIHGPEDYDSLSLRRRQRKIVIWKEENGRVIPYFRKNGQLIRVFLIHFQGPGKRVFHRFNSIDSFPSDLQIWWWNQIFQRKWLANLM